MNCQTRKRLKKYLLWTLILGFVAALLPFGINAWVVQSTRKQILSAPEAAQLPDVDCILVLGCGVSASGQPSAMLADRLKRSVSLYNTGASPKLLMSGDHGRTDYDEVNVMKTYAVDAGIPSSNVFMDHAGFSTYESLYRTRDIFQAKKIIIVTQQYHLHRALYIANALGLEAYGVAADYRAYAGQARYDLREFLARNKDFFTSLFQPKPTYLGEAIPVSGDGNLTAG